MALPNTNISVAMVKSELGAATNDVGRLCIHPNINKWSKWKPMRHSTVTVITEPQISSVKSGIDLPLIDTAQNLMANYRTTGGIWNYLQPRGGYNTPFPEPYRLGDFRNYDHEAMQFFDVITPTTVYGSSPQAPVTLVLTNNSSTYLNWNILGLDAYKFGAVAVKRNQTSPYSSNIDTLTLAQNGGDTTINSILTGATPGTQYDIFPYVALSDTGMFIPLENMNRVISVGVEFTMSGEAFRNSSTQVTSYTIWIANNTSGPITLWDTRLYIRYFDNPINAPNETGEHSFALTPNPMVIPGNTTEILTGNINNTLPDWENRYGTIYFTTSNMPLYNFQFDVQNQW